MKDEMDAAIDAIAREAEDGFNGVLEQLTRRHPAYLPGERYIGDVVTPARLVYNVQDKVWRIRCIGVLTGAKACVEQWDLIPGTGLSGTMAEMVVHMVDAHNVH